MKPLELDEIPNGKDLAEAVLYGLAFLVAGIGSVYVASSLVGDKLASRREGIAVTGIVESVRPLERLSRLPGRSYYELRAAVRPLHPQIPAYVSVTTSNAVPNQAAIEIMYIPSLAKAVLASDIGISWRDGLLSLLGAVTLWLSWKSLRTTYALLTGQWALVRQIASRRACLGGLRFSYLRGPRDVSPNAAASGPDFETLRD